MQRKTLSSLARAAGLSLVAAPALAQQPTVVLSVGDTTPAGGQIDSITAFDVDSSGRWVARVRVSGSGDTTLLSSEGGELYEGGPVPGMPAHTVHTNYSVTRDGLGNVYCVFSADEIGGGSAYVVHQNFTAPLLTDGDLLVGPDFGPNARLVVVYRVLANEGGDLLVVGLVSDVTHAPSVYQAMVLLDMEDGAIAGMSLAVDASLVYPGLQGPIDNFLGTSNSEVLSDTGRVAWAGEVESKGVAYLMPDQVLAREGGQSPVPGGDWDTPFRPTLDVNAGGSWVLAADTDADPGKDQVHVYDGAAALVEGDPFPGSPGKSYEALGLALFLSDSGERIHFGAISDVPVDKNSGIFADHSVLVRKGVTQTPSGQLVTSVYNSLGSLEASGDGNWILFLGAVDGSSDSSLLLLDRGLVVEVGEPYCSAELNSTGGFATTRAIGSAVVAHDDFRLICSGMPAGKLGYFITSQTQGDVFKPGGSQGRLCLGGTIGRFRKQAKVSGPVGRISIPVDLTDVPPPPGIAIQPGETWNFQAWFRDQNPGQTSNFSLPVSVLFQ